MRHLDYINFFATAARKHNQVADGKIVNDVVRKSFFRMNGEEEMQQTLMDAGAAFPALILLTYQGKLSAQDRGLVRDGIFGGFEVRDHLSDNYEFEEIETIRDRCKVIGEQIIGYILDDIDENGKCSLFKDFDVNSVRYQFTGPVNTVEYGCAFFFNFNSNDDAINQLDVDAVFNLP